MKLLSDVRAEYPQYDDISDKEFADALYSKFYSDIPQEEYYSSIGLTQDQIDPAPEPAEQPEEKPFGVAEYAQAPLEFGKGIARGFGSALLSSASGLAELADIATDRIGLEDLIDSGEENELIRLAGAGQEALQETLGVSDAYKDLWFTKFGEGVGSIGSFFLPTGILGAAGRAAGLAGKTTRGLQAVGAGTTAAGMGADEQAARIEQARQSGIEVSEDQEDASISLGGLVGLTEIATPLSILKKIRKLKDPELNKQAFDTIRSAIKTGTVEGVQEVTASLMQDAIQYGIYDENVPFGESLWDDFTIGAASGALVDAITTGMFNRRSRLSREVELDREKLIREEEERQREDYYNKVALAEESLKERDVQSQLAAIAAQEDAELAAADALNYQVEQSEQEALLGLIAPYQPSQEALRQPKGDIEGRDIESTVTKQGREYARQIARNASKKAGLFPSTGRFEIREEQGGSDGTDYVVYNTADGRQYGQATKDLEFAKHFSLGLNNEMINKGVNQGIIDAMDMSPEAYDQKTAESIFMIGQRVNRPKSYTISEATLNEAAGTVASKDKPFLENLTLDQIHQIQYGVPPFQDGKKKLYKDLSNLTASQQINFERAKKGLPPLKEFTLQEAKDALGDKYDKVFDVLLDVQQPDLAAIRQEFGEAGVNVQGGRQRYQDEINTRREVEDTLANKNIVSDIGSKEIKYIFKKITGESSIDSMSPSQRMFLVGELKKLPALDKPSKLPDLTPKPYTRADFNNAMNYVISTGDGTVDNIKAVLPEDLSEKRKSVAAGQIRAELLSRGVIKKDNTVSELTALPAPEPRKPTEVTERDFTTEQSVEALDFQKKLSEKLKGFGLDDIRVRILDQMKTAPDVTREGRVVSLRDRGDFSAAEGLFDTGSRTIFLGLDSARASARDQSPEAIDFALSEVMDHEIVHALRNLDLWTQKEWSLLENAAKKFKMPGTNKTFYQDAVERYVTQQRGGQKRSPVQAMEEAVAELVRYSKKDRKVIGGKPRTLIDRIFEFFRRLGSAMQGTGFNSMNDLINNIESGALGARERGVVRTARGMEAARRAVPERGVGLARDVKEFPVVEEVNASADEQAVTDNINSSIIRNYKPKKTVKAYKLFTKGEDGNLYPLFVDADAQVPVGKWIKANNPDYMFKAANGKFYVPSRGTGGRKGTGDSIAIPDQETRQMLIEAGFLPEGSTAKAITAVAARPGWHAGDSPSAKHIGGQPVVDGVKYKVRNPDQVWAEVEIPNDVDWQAEANAQAGRNKDGSIKVKEADINDRLPEGGHYRYKTNPNMEGEWLIGGEMKVIRELSRDEVKDINRKNNVEDLPSIEELRAMPKRERSKFAVNRAEREAYAEDGVQMSINRIIGRNGTELNQAPDGKFAHGLPSELLIDGPKQKARSIVVQNFTPQNTDQVLSNIQTVKSNNPDALGSTENWIAMEDDAFGGDFVPIPPLKAIQYAQSPELLAEKLKQLTPELKAGVDEGFKYVQQIKNLYNTQSTSPDLTGRLFMWGLLSRGAGPVQQEFAFLNLLKAATPYIKKASEGKMTQADVINWKRLVGKSIPSGSPAKSVTMNANDIGKLLFELGKVPEGSSQTVMQTLHNMLADPNVSGKEFRNEFFRLTNKPGVDNKVVSFIALVAGKDDVLVMDRIQGRHLWNDGRFGDKNIYDGLKKGKVKGGLNAIFAGPRGLLVTESLEDGLSSVVQQAYDMIGRPQDASVGRMHWETWVIDGSQAVSHSTLEAVRTGREIGGSVTEGKRGTFSSGTTYRQTANGPITEYPLSDGTVARMTLDQQKEFEAFIKNPKNGIIPKGFLVGRSKDRPWFELPEVNREKLDEAARRFENANPDGSIRSGNARSIGAGASDAGRRRAAAGPVGSVEAPATDEISLSLKRLDGMPESFDVNGQAVEFGYFEPAVTAAKRYTERNGRVYEPLTEYAPINEDVARKIAAEFQMMEHRPDDPEVMAAYDAMIEETKDQYRDILDTGLEVQFIKGEDPYGNPRNAILDVVNNNHLWVFPTVDGFGSDADLDVSDNPLLQATEFETADGDPMLANDVFRVVHDYFGHIKNGVGFRARGEENAWQAHAAMYSPLARRAMTTETRGQNSYVNFGPNRDFNLTANGADTVYADQKVGLLPLWVSEEARLSDPRRRDGRIFQEGLQGAIRDDGKLSLTHYSRGEIDRTDPAMAGRGLDRSRRYSPKGTYFGITEAVDDGYRKEAGLGPVENKFSVDPFLIYPLAKDHLGLIERYPAGNMDYDATIENLKNNGFIGFWNNNPSFGKAAFIFEPLIADKAAPKIMGADSDQILESLKRVDSIIERNPVESITRIYDESVTRPFLEEQEINGYPPFSWQAKTYSRGDKIIYQAADKLIGLKKAEEEINRARALAGMPPIKNKDSAYVGEESIPGKIGIEVKDFQENVQKPYAKKIADSGIPIDELDEFLTFRHAVERNNRIQLRDPSRNAETNPGSGSLKTGERLSNFYVKQIMENRYGYEWDDASESWVGGNERGKKLMDLAGNADSIVNSTIDRMIQGGLLSKDNAEALRGLYKYYAPLKGKAQEDDFADFVAVGSGLNTKGREFQRAFGRESASESPLGHIMLNAERTIARAVKNENFGQKLVNLIKDNPNSEFWNVYDATDPRFKQAADTYYTYVGSDAGMQGQRVKEIPKDMNRRDFVKYTVIKQDGLAKFDGDLIGTKIDGNEYFIEIKDDRLRRAIQSVNAGEADNLIRKFSMVNRWLSMMNTSLNPEFVIGNFSRDLQTAIYNIIGEQTMKGGKIKDVKRITRRVLKDVIPSMGIVYKGMRRYNMKDGTLRGDITGISETDYLDFREFMESGAKADWFYNRPAEEQAQTIQNMVDMANGTFTGNFRRGYTSVMDFVEDANGSVENAVRFSAFKAARDELLNSGVDRAEAVATASTLAKNLTVNFNRKGMQGDLLNALYLFYNASVQGTMNFARGLNVFDPGSSRTKQAMVASMIGFGALMAARGEEESEENPDSGRSYYSEIPDYIKERNIVIMKDNGKDYYTIPLPYGYNVFHLAGTKLFEMKNDTISVEKASGDLLSAFLGSFSPIGFFPLPTITQPFWELAKNENYFGSPIYKENFPTGVQSPASQLAMSSTRTPFKNAAKILNSLTGGNEYESGYMDVSPDALEHIAEFALGGAGTFGLRNMNAFEKWLAGEELESREVPFLRRVMGEPDRNIAVADYYDRKVKLEQKEAAIQGLRGTDRIKFRERNQDYVTMFGVLNSIERKLRKVRQMESQLRSRAALSPANAKEYAEALEVLEERKQKLYDQFNNLYDKRVGRTK